MVNCSEKCCRKSKDFVLTVYLTSRTAHLMFPYMERKKIDKEKITVMDL